MASERRNRKGHDKSTSKRSKRGVNANDIQKLISRPFKIIDTDRHDFNRIHLADIPTKEDKNIQKHQTTHTLHKKNDISVPEFLLIRHELPTKSLNPCFRSVYHPVFTLPNHYIQHESRPDRGCVSFEDFYDLKKDNIDWLIQQLLISSINDNDHNPIIHKRNYPSAINQHNISGQHLIDIINKQYQMQRVQYKTKLINAMKKNQTDKEIKKEHSLSSTNSTTTNSNHHSLNGYHKDKKRQKAPSPKKEHKNCDPFMNQSSFSLGRAASLSLDVSTPQIGLFCHNKTPPPNGSIFQFNDNMMREHSMSPANNFLFPDDASFMAASQSIPGLFAQQSYPESIVFGEKSNSNNMKKKNNAFSYKSKRNDVNITIGNTRFTRLSLSKLIYFLEYEMYRRAKYKGDPERYFPLNDVLYAVKNWDPSYDIVDVERLYYHWIQTRRKDKIQEKSLIRKFQEPPDTNDDDSNIAFRPRVSDERHVATRRQTKKPKKNTKESYIRLQMFLETMQKQCCFWKKQLEIEETKRKMVLRAIHERQELLHESQYIKYKAKVIDSMDHPDIKHNSLFNTFSSQILCKTRYRTLQYMQPCIIPYNRQNWSVMKLNDNLHDVKKYKRRWENICNRIVPSKPDVILEAVEENASHLKMNHIDGLCYKIGVVPLSDENERRFANDLHFDLNDERPYHWEINMNDNMLCNDAHDNYDITYSEKEEKIMDHLKMQRYNTIQERLLGSVSYDTDPQYTLIKKKDIEDRNKEHRGPVAVPSISFDGSLQIKVFHPLTQSMDHIEYEPTPIHDLQETDTMFDEFQIPMEPVITHYNPQRKVLKIMSGKKRKHRALLSSSALLDLISSSHNETANYTLPPAPKRQKLLHSTTYNIPNAPSSVPPLNKAQSLTQIPRKKKIIASKQNKVQPSNQVKKFTKNSVSMHSILEQNKHRQQYIQLQQKSQQLQLKKLRGINQNKNTAPKQTPNNTTQNNNNNSNTNNTTNTNNNNSTLAPIIQQTTASTPTKSDKKSKESKDTKKKKKDKSKKKKDKDKKEDKKSKKKDKSKKKSSTKKKSSKSSQKNTITTYPGFGGNNKKNDNTTHKSSKSKGSKSSNSRSNAKNIKSSKGNKKTNNINNTIHNNSLSSDISSNTRLPTPDSNPQNNPTPPPAGPRTHTAITSTMPLSGMPHLPKFDVKFDASLMSSLKFKMDINIPTMPNTTTTTNMLTSTVATPSSATQSMTMNNTPPTPPTNLQFNTIGRPKKVPKKVSGPSSVKISHHHSSTMTGRPANNMQIPTTDKRKGCVAQNNTNNKQNNRYSFMTSATDNVVIAMPPNPSNTNTNTATNSNSNSNTNTAQRMNSIPVAVPAIPQLPQIPPNTSFSVNNPPNTRRTPNTSSNNNTPKSVPTMPSFPQQTAPQSQQYTQRSNVQQEQQQRIHRQTPSHGAQRMNQSQRQRSHSIHKTQPPFPPSFNAASVPPPPSAMPSNVGLQSQYNGGSMRNRPQRNTHHQQQTHQQQSHLPQFGATPSINQSSMMSGSMNPPPTMHNHPMSYRQSHRNNTVPPSIHSIPNNIPLSPRQMNEMRHNRITNNRNKQINPKEIIELDQ